MKIKDKEIGPLHPPYLIAEACNNFNGDVVMAKEMVGAAEQAGADAIKFQMRIRPDRISPDEHMELKELCDKTGITYLCSAYDELGLEILSQMGVPAIKIGSAECINIPFLEAARKYDIPLIISTGGTGWRDVIKITEYADILLHCMSIYPTPFNQVYLDTISYYALQFDGLPIGYSDHSPTIYPAIGAVAVGACVIEKHFILDKRIESVDASVSADPDELFELSRAISQVWESGGINLIYRDEERFKLEQFRRG